MTTYTESTHLVDAKNGIEPEPVNFGFGKCKKRCSHCTGYSNAEESEIRGKCYCGHAYDDHYEKSK